MLTPKEFVERQVKAGLKQEQIAELIDRLYTGDDNNRACDELLTAFTGGDPVNAADAANRLRMRGLNLSQFGRGDDATFEWRLKGHKGVIACSLTKLKRKSDLNWEMMALWTNGYILDCVPDRMWRDTVKELLVNGRLIEIPDTDKQTQILRLFCQRLEQRGEGWEVSDLRSGCYVVKTNKGKLCRNFLPDPIMRFIRSNLGYPIRESDLAYALTKVGLLKGRKANAISLKEGSIRVWAVPVETLEKWMTQNLEKEVENDKKTTKKQGKMDSCVINGQSQSMPDI